MDNTVCGSCLVCQIIQLRRSIFKKKIGIFFVLLQLEIALAIPVSSDKNTIENIPHLSFTVVLMVCVDGFRDNSKGELKHQ